MSPDDTTNTSLARAAAGSGSLDVTIPRSALERVLARASELQASTGEPTESITESRLLEIAREVGIPADSLRQALAEERARLPYSEPEQGPLLNALGVTSVSAQRTVEGTPQTILAALEPWMQRMELMAVQRRMVGRVTWEPVYSIANFLRPTGPTGRRRDLARVDHVTVSVTPVDDVRCVVRFDVQLDHLRRSHRNLAVGLSIGASLPVILALGLPLLILPMATAFSAAVMALLATVPMAISFGLWRAIRSSFRRTVTRAQLRIEQLLDELEQGTLVTAPSLLGQLRDAMLNAASAARSTLPPAQGDR